MEGLQYDGGILPTHALQYCPMCRAALVRKVLFDDGIPRVTCVECGWIQLITNATGVVVVAHGDAGVVAIRPPNETGIAFPAGLIEYGETPEAAAVREVKEETGLTVKLIQSLGWFFEPYPDWPGPMIYFVYEAHITGGGLRHSDEGRAQFYPLAELPAIATGRKGSQMALKMFLASRR
ncbi:MAG: NUDIX domain-containing protein [Caldilineaceae bacterium]